MSPNVQAASSVGRIALAGATGRIGSALAAGLVSDPVSVVALTRDPQTARLPDTTAVVAVDFDQPGSLESALQGAKRLFIVHGTSPRQVRNEIALIDAAVKVGVAHVVKVSSMGPPSTLPPFAWHIAIEAHLAKQPIGYTVLRPSAFVDILRRAGSQVSAGNWGGAAGEGLVNFIDTRDVADVARAALLAEIEPGTQRVHHLTGSRGWSMPQIAEELSRLLGRKVIYAHRTPAAQREQLPGFSANNARVHVP
jgi:NAD(P)H dehydrogenase (quinone)